MSMKELRESLETLGGAIRADAADKPFYPTHRPVMKPPPPVPPLRPCAVRQYSDQMSCSTCGLTWDVNDIVPLCPR